MFKLTSARQWNYFDLKALVSEWVLVVFLRALITAVCWSSHSVFSLTESKAPWERTCLYLNCPGRPTLWGARMHSRNVVKYYTFTPLLCTCVCQLCSSTSLVEHLDKEHFYCYSFIKAVRSTLHHYALCAYLTSNIVISDIQMCPY
jgi:hypothetical protein